MRIDHCGQVDTISEHAAMLIPFYFFPLIILLVIITRKIVLKVKHVITSHINRPRFEILLCKDHRWLISYTHNNYIAVYPNRFIITFLWLLLSLLSPIIAIPTKVLVTVMYCTYKETAAG